MKNGDIIEICASYFFDNPNLEEIMDPKSGDRVYIGIFLQMDKNN